jgi:hypothetical protein
MTLDKEAQEGLDELIEGFLSFAEKVERESSERCAKTGETPTRVLIEVDRETGRIAIVPVDEPPEPDQPDGEPAD